MTTAAYAAKGYGRDPASRWRPGWPRLAWPPQGVAAADLTNALRQRWWYDPARDGAPRMFHIFRRAAWTSAGQAAGDGGLAAGSPRQRPRSRHDLVEFMGACHKLGVDPAQVLGLWHGCDSAGFRRDPASTALNLPTPFVVPHGNGWTPHRLPCRQVMRIAGGGVLASAPRPSWSALKPPPDDAVPIHDRKAATGRSPALRHDVRGAGQGFRSVSEERRAGRPPRPSLSRSLLADGRSTTTRLLPPAAGLTCSTSTSRFAASQPPAASMDPEMTMVEWPNVLDHGLRLGCHRRRARGCGRTATSTAPVRARTPRRRCWSTPQLLA